MRMWSTNPKYLCKNHLLGEHSEIHKHKHNFIKKHKMHNRILWDQIDAYKMKERHDLLAQEMLNRGYNHKTPYEQPDVSYLPELKGSLACALDKCEECRKRIINEIFK